MKSFWESPRQLCVLKRTTQVLKSTCKLVVVRKAFFGERVDPRWIDLLSRQLQFQQMEQVFFLIGSVELLHEFCFTHTFREIQFFIWMQAACQFSINFLQRFADVLSRLFRPLFLSKGSG